MKMVGEDLNASALFAWGTEVNAGIRKARGAGDRGDSVSASERTASRYNQHRPLVRLLWRPDADEGLKRRS